MVACILQRGGKIELEVVGGNDKQTLQGFVQDNTTPDAEAIYTDEHPSYKGIERLGPRHESVNHSAEQWVNGDVHTNTIESQWSLVKRSIVGSYHKVSIKHLDAYLDEVEWRQNNRENQYLFRDTLRKLLQAEILEYKKLTAEAL